MSPCWSLYRAIWLRSVCTVVCRADVRPACWRAELRDDDRRENAQDDHHDQDFDQGESLALALREVTWRRRFDTEGFANIDLLLKEPYVQGKSASRNLLSAGPRAVNATAGIEAERHFQA